MAPQRADSEPTTAAASETDSDQLPSSPRSGARTAQKAVAVAACAVAQKGSVSSDGGGDEYRQLVEERIEHLRQLEMRGMQMADYARAAYELARENERDIMRLRGEVTGALSAHKADYLREFGAIRLELGEIKRRTFSRGQRAVFVLATFLVAAQSALSLYLTIRQDLP